MLCQVVSHEAHEVTGWAVRGGSGWERRYPGSERCQPQLGICKPQGKASCALLQLQHEQGWMWAATLKGILLVLHFWDVPLPSCYAVPTPVHYLLWICS